MNQYSQQIHPKRSSFDATNETFLLMLRGKWCIIGCALLFGLVALCYVMIATPIYNTKALIQLHDNTVPKGTEIADDDLTTDDTSIDIIRSSAILNSIITSENANGKPLPALSVSEKVKNARIIEVTLKGPDPTANEKTLNKAIQQYQEHQLKATRTALTPNNAKPNNHEGITTANRYKGGSTTLNWIHQPTQAVESVQILSAAKSSTSPVKPQKILTVMLAILLGGILGIAIIFIREKLRQGLRTPEEVMQKTGLPVLATLLTSDKESVNILLVNLLYLLTQAGNNRVMICSPTPGAGARYAITHLAIALSDINKKVLLIDADMRQGDIFNHFDMTSSHSLADVLAKGDHSVSTVRPNLDLISGTSYPPNPSELLMEQSFEHLLQWASDQYDVVLVHPPSVLDVTDAAIVSQLCDTNLMVIRSEKTSAQQIIATKRRLQLVGVTTKGCILNRVTA